MLRVNEEYMANRVNELIYLLGSCEEAKGDEQMAFYTDNTNFLNICVSEMSVKLLEILLLPFININFIPFASVAFRSIDCDDIYLISALKEDGYKEFDDIDNEVNKISLYKEKTNVVYVDFKNKVLV